MRDGTDEETDVLNCSGACPGSSKSLDSLFCFILMGPCGNSIGNSADCCPSLNLIHLSNHRLSTEGPDQVVKVSKNSLSFPKLLVVSPKGKKKAES